jgi:hypothetical protein
MKKSDLVSGMWVELRNGEKYLVLSKEGIILSEKSWEHLNNFREDLKNKKYSSLDIIKVYNSNTSLKPGWLIWERKEEISSEDIKALERILNKLKGECR